MNTAVYQLVAASGKKTDVYQERMCIKITAVGSVDKPFRSPERFRGKKKSHLIFGSCFPHSISHALGVPKKACRHAEVLEPSGTYLKAWTNTTGVGSGIKNSIF